MLVAAAKEEEIIIHPSNNSKIKRKETGHAMIVETLTLQRDLNVIVVENRKRVHQHLNQIHHSFHHCRDRANSLFLRKLGAVRLNNLSHQNRKKERKRANGFAKLAMRQILLLGVTAVNAMLKRTTIKLSPRPLFPFKKHNQCLNNLRLSPR